MKIRFEERKELKQKPDMNNLGFGQVFTDYMVVVDYDPEHGWHDARIVPTGPSDLTPER